MLLSTSGTISRRGRFANTFCVGIPVVEDEMLIVFERDKAKIISKGNYSIWTSKH